MFGDLKCYVFGDLKGYIPRSPRVDPYSATEAFVTLAHPRTVQALMPIDELLNTSSAEDLNPKRLRVCAHLR